MTAIATGTLEALFWLDTAIDRARSGADALAGTVLSSASFCLEEVKVVTSVDFLGPEDDELFIVSNSELCLTHGPQLLNGLGFALFHHLRVIN